MADAPSITVFRDGEGNALYPLRYEGVLSLWPVLAFGGCVFADVRTGGAFDASAIRAIVPPSWIKKAGETEPKGFVQVRHHMKSQKCPRYDVPKEALVHRRLPLVVQRAIEMFHAVVVSVGR